MRLKGKGARALALGSQGDEVMALQERLSQLGYDPGPLDGRFGYLTQDAVTAFQRDNGLRVDGIAGLRVRSLMQQSSLPGQRKTLVLGAGEDIASAATRFGVSIEALRYMNRLAPGARGYPGQRLVCRTHYVVAAVTSQVKDWRVVRKAATYLSAVTVPIAHVVNGRLETCESAAYLTNFVEGARNERLQVWLSVLPIGRTVGGAESQMDVSLLLSRAKMRKEAARLLAELSRTHRGGIWLDLGRPRWGDGPKLLAFVKSLRECLSEHGWPLMITLPLPEGNARWRWWLTDVDYAALSTLADRVVLGAHIPGSLDSFAMYCQRLEALLEMTPAWKALLGISLRAEVRNAQGDLLGEMAYPRAVTTAYLAKVRPKWDPVRQFLRVPITASQGEGCESDSPLDTHSSIDRVLWLPGRDAIAERLALVHRYNLAGVAFVSLGEEDARVWDVVPRRILTEHLGT